ncbi:MAG: serine hydrolase, partial [Anaerolineae bacterium]|nr:serine hydrolase [Anaerolineae bacterium]
LQAISLDLTGEDAALTLCDERGEHHISVGSGDWVLGTTAFDAAISRSAPAAVQRPVAASGAWTAGDTYAVRLCFYQTPFCPTIALRFSGDEVTYGFKINVAFGPLERPELVGKAG